MAPRPSSTSRTEATPSVAAQIDAVPAGTYREHVNARRCPYEHITRDGRTDVPKRGRCGYGPHSGAYVEPKRAAPHLLRNPIHRRTLPAVSGGSGNQFPWTETGSRCASALRMQTRRCPRNGKRARDREEPLCIRHGKVRSLGCHIHSRVRRPARDTHSATRVGRCQTGYDICVSQPSVVSARAFRVHLDARGVCRSRQMTILVAAALSPVGDAASLSPVAEGDLIHRPVRLVSPRWSRHLAAIPNRIGPATLRLSRR